MIRIETHRATPSLLLAAGAAALFLGGLGRLPLFGRDEALYAEAAREMLATGDWITPRVNGVPFLEKPPLYYWLAGTSCRAFGVSPFAARLPAALLGLLTVALTAAVGARVWGRRAGLLAGIALASCLQMAVIGRMGILDVPLTFLTTLALLAYARWRTRGGLVIGASFGLCVGLAVLLKGMAGLLPVAVAAVHLLAAGPRVERTQVRPGRRAGRTFLAFASASIACVVFALVAVPWFWVMGRLHGDSFGSTLFLREHLTRMAEPMQGHGGPVFYYAGLLAVSFFPWIVFLPAALGRRGRPRDETSDFWHSLLIVWLAVVLVPFSLIRTKLPGYVTPMFPAMALLVGVELDRRLRRPGRAPWIAAIVGAVVLAGLASLLPTLGARVGGRVGASEDASRLVGPMAVWLGGYGVILLGAALALSRRVHAGTGVMVAGQAVILSAILAGVLPVLSPHLEGGKESRLAELARRELPRSRVVLYDTRPEAVAFVLQRTAQVFSRDQRTQVRAALRTGPTALIASAKEQAFWEELPANRIWRSGDRVLLEVPKLIGEPEGGGERN